MRADSGFYTHAVAAVCRKTKVRFSITIRQRASLRNLIEAIPEADWTPIPYWMDGAANAAWLAVQVLAHHLWPALGSPHRSGRATGNHQDPQTTLLLYGRTAYPLGAQTHFASSPGLGPGLSRPLSPWPGCEPSHSQPDGAIRNRPNASNLASARSAGASCCVRPHYHAIPSLHRPLSRPGAATENPLPCHIGPNGAQAFSLVGSLIPICPAFTHPIGGFGLRSDVHFRGLEDYRKDSTAPHITLMPQLGDHRQCGPAICTFHLGFSSEATIARWA